MEGSRTAAVASRKAGDRMRKVMNEAGSECRGIADRLGFPFFHLSVRTVVPPGLPLQLFVDGGPQGFRDLYDAQVGFENDPVLRKALTSITPFGLREAIGDDDREALTAMRELGRMGIADGVVVPLHGPRASHGMLTLLSSAPLPPSAQRQGMVQDAQCSSLAMFDRTLLAVGRAHQSNVRKQLTKRQLDALHLAANGRVLSEIAEEMKVHPSTARYLVTRAADKLGVETRVEAIVRMAALGDFFHGLYPGSLTGSILYFAEPARGDGD